MQTAQPALIVIAIAGPSGVGKSTLVRVVAAFLNQRPKCISMTMPQSRPILPIWPPG